MEVFNADKNMFIYIKRIYADLCAFSYYLVYSS
jgi:hypothetical protein